MSPQELAKIKEVTKEFFQQADLVVEIAVGKPQDSTVPVDLKTDDPQILIGERGQTLAEIQRLIKAIVRRKIVPAEPFFIDIDINDYKKKKAEYLKETAKTAADEVVLTKREKELPPMSPYERRVVHMELAQRADVITESIGEEPERRILIKARPSIDKSAI
jgi:spoIIIJ-associated protein